jgi:hypothetical protein
MPERYDDNNSIWKNLYRIGGAAAITIVILIPIQIFVFVISPPPDTAKEYFMLFHNNSLLGLLSLDLLLIVDYVLMIPIFLALYVTLRRVSESVAAIGTLIGFIGAVAYFASNTAFDVFYLAQQYETATTESQKSFLLAAGHAMLAIFQGTSFHVSYVLVSVATLLLSILVLKSKIFSKIAGYAGILVAVIGLGIYVPIIGLFLSIISLIPGVFWYVFVAKSLLQLSK